MKRPLDQGDVDYASTAVTDEYIQHNPTVKTGKAGFLEAVLFLKQMPKPAHITQPFMRIIAEGDYVAVHWSVDFAGQKKNILDLFRLENGLIAEHWDAIEDNTTAQINSNPEVEGPVKIEEVEKTAKNKSLVIAYNNQILIDHKWQLISNFVAVNLTEHHAQIKNGNAQLKAHYENVRIEKVHKTIGEGNFVLTQSKGLINEEAHVIYDVYRLHEGKIVEHWSVTQKIPAQMVHDNGMI